MDGGALDAALDSLRVTVQAGLAAVFPFVPDPVVLAATEARAERNAGETFNGARVAGCYRLDTGPFGLATEAITLARSDIQARVKAGTVTGFARPAGDIRYFTRVALDAGPGLGYLPTEPCCVALSPTAARILNFPTLATDATPEQVAAELRKVGERYDAAVHDTQLELIGDTKMPAPFTWGGVKEGAGDVLDWTGETLAKAIALALDAASRLVKPLAVGVLTELAPVIAVVGGLVIVFVVYKVKSK